MANTRYSFIIVIVRSLSPDRLLSSLKVSASYHVDPVTWERRWCSGEHSCLPSSWPGSNSQPTQWGLLCKGTFSRLVFAGNKTSRGLCPKCDRKACMDCLAAQNGHFQSQIVVCQPPSSLFVQPNDPSMLCDRFMDPFLYSFCYRLIDVNCPRFVAEPSPSQRWLLKPCQHFLG